HQGTGQGNGRVGVGDHHHGHDRCQGEDVGTRAGNRRHEKPSPVVRGWMGDGWKGRATTWLTPRRARTVFSWVSEDARSGLGRADGFSQGREELSSGAGGGVLTGTGGFTPGQVGKYFQSALCRIEADGVAVTQESQWSTRRGLGGDVDGGGDLPGGTGHAPVGDQGDLLPTILQYRQLRGEFVQLGHAVGTRSLKPDDGHEVPGQLTVGEGLLK